jgi:hypothetical protein
MNVEEIRAALETTGGHELIKGFMELQHRMERRLIDVTTSKGVSLEDVLRARGMLDGVELCVNNLKEWSGAPKKADSIR